jgi:hypothetical protein
VKRDPELIRNILLRIEANPAGNTLEHMEFEGHTWEDIAEHVQLLIDASFIDGTVTGQRGKWPTAFLVQRLTWIGHEFLAKARNDTLWKKVVAQAQEKGMSTSMSIINGLLEAAAKKYVGLD